MKKWRKWLSIGWIVLGAVLWTLGLLEKLDEFWGSMGFALITVGSLQLLKRHRLSKNEEYRERMEVEATDERYHYIRSRAWAWAGYLFILIVSVLVIVLRILGQDLLSMAGGYAVCLMLVLYWVSYLVLQKKY